MTASLGGGASEASAARRSSQSTRRRVCRRSTGGERRGAPPPAPGRAVAGTDQRQAQHLAALVDVGPAGQGQLEQQLPQRGAVPPPRDPPLERLEVAQELAVPQQRARE